MSGFTKATKKQARLRCALFGPSGSGKTFSALRIATGMGGKIGVIDTENRSACKYADRFEFDVLELENQSIEDYANAINQATKEGINVLVVDSLSHGWQELLQEMDDLAKAKYRGNSWSAWSEGTPRQKLLVKSLLSFPGHIIATMRSKTEWATEQGSNGKTKPTRVGLAPEQGKGIEYEFDLLLELNIDHICTVIKDRTGKYQDALLKLPGEEFGAELVAWLADGVPEKVTWMSLCTSKPELGKAVKSLGYTKPSQLDEVWERFGEAENQGLAFMQFISDSIEARKLAEAKEAAAEKAADDAASGRDDSGFLEAQQARATTPPIDLATYDPAGDEPCPF